MLPAPQPAPSVSATLPPASAESASISAYQRLPSEELAAFNAAAYQLQRCLLTLINRFGRDHDCTVTHLEISKYVIRRRTMRAARVATGLNLRLRHRGHAIEL